jgi:hypothetical protein
MNHTPYGPNVRIRTTRDTAGSGYHTQDFEIVEERVNDKWEERGRFGHMSDDYAFSNAGALARSLATKHIGGH